MRRLKLFRGQRLLRGSVCFDLGTVKGNMVQAHDVVEPAEIQPVDKQR